MRTITIQFSNETVAALLCYTTVLLILLYLILIIYNANKYWQNRYNIILQKRYSYITMYTAILLIPKLSFNMLMYIRLLHIEQESSEYTIYLAIDETLGILFYYLWVWRFWLIFYDTKWIISILNRRWQNLINPNHQRSKKDNWFLRNRLTFGNANWIFCRRIFPVTLLSILFLTIPPIVLSYMESYDSLRMWDTVHLISSSLYYVPFILLAVILCKLPAFNDEFFIISECKRIFITFCVDNIVHLTVFAVPTLIEHNQRWRNRLDDGYVADHILFPVIGFNVINLSQTVAILISTKWVIHKVYILGHIYDVSKANIRVKRKGFSDIDTYEHSLSVSVQVLKLHHTQSSLQQDLISKHTYNYGDDLGITLIDVLTNERAFDIFVKHLSLEFSLECLLSLIEFIQFQQMMDEYIHHLQFTVSRQNLNRCCSSTSPLPQTDEDDAEEEGSLSFNEIAGHDEVDENTNMHARSISTASAPAGCGYAFVANFKNQINSAGPSTQKRETHGKQCSKQRKKKKAEKRGEGVRNVFNDHEDAGKIDEEVLLVNNIQHIISDQEWLELQKRMFLYKRIQFPCNVPKSKIVFDGMDEYVMRMKGMRGGNNKSAEEQKQTNVCDHDEFVRQCKLKACTLYRKYVASGGGLEINIGWNIRKKLQDVMGNNDKIVLDISLVEQWHIDLYGLIRLFEQCCNQMLILMKDSFDRFKQTKQFDNLKKKLFSQNLSNHHQQHHKITEIDDVLNTKWV